MKKRKEVYTEVKEMMGVVPEWVDKLPEGAVQGFWDTAQGFWLADTKIPNKYKELIGLAVAGANRCKYCTYFHTEAAKMFGATEDEIREAGMMGAFSSMASTFIHAKQIDYDKFREETRSVVEHFKKSR